MKNTLVDGKYEILREIGRGGMGTVFEARHRTTGRNVALKVMASSALACRPDIMARFQREIRASGSIHSPFVVQVFDAGVDVERGSPYMAMELLVGEDLQDVIRRLGPLTAEVVLRIFAQACQGLQKAHDAGIVHRDIKSSNIFLARHEGDWTEITAKILDFGIAKVRSNPLLPGGDHKLTRTGSMLGSPMYMSPEQAVGATDVDVRTDIFSLGVTMYEALSGATPHGHLESLGALIMATCTQPATPLHEVAPWVPADVSAIVHKALALDVRNRYQTASELRAAIVALLPKGDLTVRAPMVVGLSEQELHTRCPSVPVEMGFTTTVPRLDDFLPDAVLDDAPIADTIAALPMRGAPGDRSPSSNAKRPRGRRSARWLALSLMLSMIGGYVAFRSARHPFVHGGPGVSAPLALVAPEPALPAVAPREEGRPAQAPTARAAAAPTSPAALVPVRQPMVSRPLPLPASSVSLGVAAPPAADAGAPMPPSALPRLRSPAELDRDDPWRTR